MAEEEAVLQGKTDRLIEVGRYCGMEMNVENTKATAIASLLSPALEMIVQTQPENVEYFNYLRNTISNGARCRREIKSRTVMAKAAVDQRQTFSPTNWT